FPDTEMIYSDEDKIDGRARRSSPSFKPDWSPELFYSLNLVTHLSVYRTSILRDIAGFRTGFEGSQDYDLGLRVSERIDQSRIRHIPRVLYHWRTIPGSVALDSSEKDYAHERARKSISEHFERTGIDAAVTRGYLEWHRVKYALPEMPVVSLILSGSGSPDPVDEILAATAYPRIEVIRTGKSFTALNAAAGDAEGSLLCFLDLATTAHDPQWLTELVGVAMQKGIAGVGPKIIYPNSRIKSAGNILGISSGVGRAHHRAPGYCRGNFFRLRVAQNVAALPVDCLMIRKEVFNSLGGFDTEAFPDNYADVDLCIRLLEKGYRNVWTPWAEIIQSNERIFIEDKELDLLKARWPAYFERDPYYNPNLTSATEDLSLAFPPRISKT
ncbi:MAG: glycosyltransferase family 2 protein, partial [Candidatus Binatia bacterium]